MLTVPGMCASMTSLCSLIAFSSYQGDLPPVLCVPVAYAPVVSTPGRGCTPRMLAPGNETSVNMLLLYPMIARLGPSSPIFWCSNTPSRTPTSVPGQQDECVRGPCPRGSLARQFAASCLLRTLILWLVPWLRLSAVATKLREGLGARGPPSQTSRTGHHGGDSLSPGLSHWNFVITEWNPRHGVIGAECPSCPFRFLAFASQLL